MTPFRCQAILPIGARRAGRDHAQACRGSRQHHVLLRSFCSPVAAADLLASPKLPGRAAVPDRECAAGSGVPQQPHRLRARSAAPACEAGLCRLRGWLRADLPVMRGGILSERPIGVLGAYRTGVGTNAADAYTAPCMARRGHGREHVVSPVFIGRQEEMGALAGTLRRAHGG